VDPDRELRRQVDRDQALMREALAEARGALDDGELPFGAVLTDGDRIIGRARASDRRAGNRVSHAESALLMGARLTGLPRASLTLYTTVEPCVMCTGAILIEGIGRVVYGLASPVDGGLYLLRDAKTLARCGAAAPPELRAGVLEDECRALFVRFIDRVGGPPGLVDFARRLLAGNATGLDARASTVAFVPLDESHISLIHAWLNSGEAFRWYGRRPRTEEEIRQKYLVEKPRTGTRRFIIQYEGRPIGYLQYYRIADYPDYCSLVSAKPHDYGLDLFIGRDDYIGRGIGTRVVKTALDELVFAHDDAERCLVGPSPENGRAIRCYEKCGFRHERTVVSDTGEREYLMVATRYPKTGSERGEG